jgi:hypothetical protein
MDEKFAKSSTQADETPFLRSLAGKAPRIVGERLKMRQIPVKFVPWLFTDEQKQR